MIKYSTKASPKAEDSALQPTRLYCVCLKGRRKNILAFLQLQKVFPVKKKTYPTRKIILHENSEEN